MLWVKILQLKSVQKFDLHSGDTIEINIHTRDTSHHMKLQIVHEFTNQHNFLPFPIVTTRSEKSSRSLVVIFFNLVIFFIAVRISIGIEKPSDIKRYLHLYQIFSPNLMDVYFWSFFV